MSRSVLERGRYLTEAGDCIACHTRPGGPPLAGGRAITTPFGIVHSTNITPDASGIGGWTADDFYRALHEGRDARGRHLYPAFPYDYYTNVTRTDSDAIFSYLRTVTPIPQAPIPNQLGFPFNIRALLFFWKLAFLRKEPLGPDPAHSAQWNRGAYLVEGLGHCGACHSPMNVLGAPKRDRHLWGGTTQKWSAPDLTPHPIAGLGRWSQADIVEFLQSGHNAHSTAFAEMKEIIASSTSRMTSEDLTAVAVYLADLPSSAPDETDRGIGTMQDAESIWMSSCSACHGMQAQGVVEMVPSLRSRSECQQVKATTLAHVILTGIETDPVDLPMPAFHDKLSDRQIASVITYLCSKWSGRAPSVATHEVAKLRRTLAPLLRSRPEQPPVDEHDHREIRQGDRLYSLFNCDSCHARGGGDIGPALMDDRWRYGGELKQVHDTIARGRPNGMPAFGHLIPDRQIWQIAAYVRSLEAVDPSEPAAAE